MQPRSQTTPRFYLAAVEKTRENLSNNGLCVRAAGAILKLVCQSREPAVFFFIDGGRSERERKKKKNDSGSGQLYTNA